MGVLSDSDKGIDYDRVKMLGDIRGPEVTMIWEALAMGSEGKRSPEGVFTEKGQ